jgi:hypothetical protein
MHKKKECTPLDATIQIMVSYFGRKMSFAIEKNVSRIKQEEDCSTFVLWLFVRNQ